MAKKASGKVSDSHRLPRGSEEQMLIFEQGPMNTGQQGIKKSGKK